MTGMIRRSALAALALILCACATPAGGTHLFTATSQPSSTTLPPSPTSLPGPEATGTAEMGLKETAIVEATMTAAARPTQTPTPVVTPPGVLCKASDLKGEAHAEGATGSIVFSLKLTNQGSMACGLAGPPDIQLVGANGEPLDVKISLTCFECTPQENPYATASPATQRAVSSTATAQAAQILTSITGLVPGQSANVFLIWRNWCKPFPEGGLSLWLKLPQELGTVKMPTDAYTGGRCDVPTAGSTLVVSQYQR